MKLYLAARFGRRDELNMHRQRLESMGHEITSRWLTQHQALDLNDPSARYSDADRLMFATHDFRDVKKAEGLIAFTEDPQDSTAVGGRRGGRHVELGLALAWGMRTFVCGYRENVFCYLPPIVFCPSFDEVCAALGFAVPQS